MAKIPRDTNFDGTLSLFFEGYRFIEKRCELLRSDVFETRLMLHKAICMRGARAAEIFYDADKFQRAGAFPRRGLKTLLGENGVQTLDDAPHHHRKALFMSLMTPENIENLTEIVRLEFLNNARRWEKMPEVRLFDESQEILCRAVCEWAGVPLEEHEVTKRTRDFESMIEGGTRVGWRHWRGRFARRRAEKWIGRIIENARARKNAGAETNALNLVANFRNFDGGLLDVKTAAVELLNILRPTVAVARYIVFAAHALHENPAVETKLKAGNLQFFEHFLEEVRRFYPFFPFAAALVKKEFFWNGYHFPPERWVILDLYATNHDADLWANPRRFLPERFEAGKIDRFNLIPQGGNGHARNHRCPGEWITLAVMKTAVEFLLSQIEYEVPAQDLSIDLSEIPALPASRFIIGNVRVT